jgi:hypothetical protein
MLRNILAVSMVLALAASTQAAIMTSLAIAPTVGVPGMNTYTLTAIAPAGEKIIGFDFVGGGGLFGFNGPMNQINPVGQSTVFNDNNAFFPFVPADTSADSQFKVKTTEGIALNGAEGANLLKGAFNYSAANVGALASNVWAFVQIATSNPEAVTFKGTLTVRNGQGVDRLEPLEGALPEPTTLALLCLGLAGGLGVLRRRS